MLLTGAAIVRFANTFLDAFKAKDFVLITIFIWDDGKATRYALFQEQNDRTVYYKERTFSLNDPVGRVEFARQFYNLYMLGDEEAENTKEKVEQFKDCILLYQEEFGPKSFHTDTDDNDNTQAKGRQRSSTGGSAGARGIAGSVHAADCAELRAHGYEVKMEAEDIVDARGIVYEPLF